MIQALGCCIALSSHVPMKATQYYTLSLEVVQREFDL